MADLQTEALMTMRRPHQQREPRPVGHPACSRTPAAQLGCTRRSPKMRAQRGNGASRRDSQTIAQDQRGTSAALGTAPEKNSSPLSTSACAGRRPAQADVEKGERKNKRVTSQHLAISDSIFCTTPRSFASFINRLPNRLTACPTAWVNFLSCPCSPQVPLDLLAQAPGSHCLARLRFPSGVSISR